jgi:hypothetical protein
MWRAGPFGAFYVPLQRTLNWLCCDLCDTIYLLL